MADLQKFNQLLKLNDYTTLEYFSHSGYCNLVKVVHILSGKIFYISISRSFRLKITEDVSNHYLLTKEDAKNREFTSSQLADQYPMIQLQAQGDEIIDNICKKLRKGIDAFLKSEPVMDETTVNFVKYIHNINQIDKCKVPWYDFAERYGAGASHSWGAALERS
jgi:hypothetical protein